jgi:hypothetical protein
VTNRGGSSSSNARATPSPLPALEALSDESSRESPGSNLDSGSGSSHQRPIKVSNWRKRGIHHLPPPYPTDHISLDHSDMRRRDLPIKLVVDEPVPVHTYQDELYSLAPAKIRRSTSRRSHDGDGGVGRVIVDNNSNNVRKRQTDTTRRRAVSDREEKIQEVKCLANDFASFEPFKVVEPMLWVPFAKVSKSESGTSTTEKGSYSVNHNWSDADSLHVFEDAEAMQGLRHTNTVARGTSAALSEAPQSSRPVLRVQYKGEMVSVIGQTTTDLQELSWV